MRRMRIEKLANTSWIVSGNLLVTKLENAETALEGLHKVAEKLAWNRLGFAERIMSGAWEKVPEIPAGWSVERLGKKEIVCMKDKIICTADEVQDTIEGLEELIESEAW